VKQIDRIPGTQLSVYIARLKQKIPELVHAVILRQSQVNKSDNKTDRIWIANSLGVRNPDSHRIQQSHCSSWGVMLVIPGIRIVRFRRAVYNLKKLVVSKSTKIGFQELGSLSEDFRIPNLVDF
jgi:hypothetical protein